MTTKAEDELKCNGQTFYNCNEQLKQNEEQEVSLLKLEQHSMRQKWNSLVTQNG